MFVAVYKNVDHFKLAQFAGDFTESEIFSFFSINLLAESKLAVFDHVHNGNRPHPAIKFFMIFFVIEVILSHQLKRPSFYFIFLFLSHKILRPADHHTVLREKIMMLARKMLLPDAVYIIFLGAAPVFISVVIKLPNVVNVPAKKHVGVLVENKVIKIVVKMASGVLVKDADAIVVRPFKHPWSKICILVN